MTFNQFWDGYSYLTLDQALDVYASVHFLEDKNKCLMDLLERWYAWQATSKYAFVSENDYSLVTDTANIISEKETT